MSPRQPGDLRDRVPVEPLAPEVLDRIERRALYAYEGAETGPAARPWAAAMRWLVPAVAVAGVALAIALNLRGADSAQPRAVVVDHGQTVELRRSGGLSVYEIDGAIIRLAEDTDALVRRDHGGLTVELELGRVDCEVEPRPARSPFRVRAGQVEVVVVGTAFGVERDADGAVRVEVTRGVVRVNDGTADRELVAGQRWRGGRTETAAIPPTPANAPPAGEGDRDPVIGLAPDPAPATTGRSPTPPGPSAGRTPAPAEADDAITLPRPSSPAAAFAGMSDAELEDIMAIEARDPREAVRRYRAYSLAHDGTPAARALYSETYVRYYRLGDRGGALRAMQLYERRFPTDARSESALWLRVTLLCDGELERACRAAAHTYLRRFPSGGWAEAARTVINESM
jgi:hypothetical protein